MQRRARSVLLRNNTFWPHLPDLVMKTSEEGSFFFALTGAQGMLICVHFRSFFCSSGHMFICPSSSNVSKALNLYLSFLNLQATLSELHQLFVGQTEPRLLRLVFFWFLWLV